MPVCTTPTEPDARAGTLKLGPTRTDTEARDQLRAIVSHETFERLDCFIAMLVDWNRRLNLISSSTIDTLWQRHVTDSAQLVTIKPIQSGRWVDIGTGGGFPGLVVAILSAELAPDVESILLEANQRKTEFLRRVVQATGIRTSVVVGRAETIDALGASRISVRAVAPLVTLLPLVARHLDRHGIALLMKGKTVDRELGRARQTWRFTACAHASMTGTGSVLALSEIAPAVRHG